MVLDLYEDDTPTTINSFMWLTLHHYYDGIAFHRVVEGFVVQGGDPEGNGKGGAGYNLPDEPPKYGYREGTVAMANAAKATSRARCASSSTCCSSSS